MAQGYFADTRPALDRSWICRRWAGFPFAQEAAGDAIHDYLMAGSRRDTAAVISQLRSLMAREGS